MWQVLEYGPPDTASGRSEVWRVTPPRNVAWPVAVICYMRFRIGGRDFGLATDILGLMVTGWHRAETVVS